MHSILPQSLVRDILDACRLFLPPIGAGFFVSWLAFYTLRRVIHWNPNGFSPFAASVMVAMLAWCMRMLLIGGNWSPESMLIHIASMFIFSAPIPFVVAPMFFIYMRMALAGEVRIKRGVAIWVSALCFGVNLLLLHGIFSGS